MNTFHWADPSTARSLPAAAIDCRSDGRHDFGRIADHIRSGNWVTSLTLKGVVFRIPCGQGLTDKAGRPLGCGVHLDVAYTLKGHCITRSVDYSTAKDENGESTYLLPKGSGRLHPEDARGALFEQMNLEARAGPSTPGAKVVSIKRGKKVA